jgi:hypothetical protein
VIIVGVAMIQFARRDRASKDAPVAQEIPA